VIGYLRLELARTCATCAISCFAIGAPVGFYLLFCGVVFGGQTNGAPDTFGLPASVEIMVAMATFGAMWAALSSTAPRLARDSRGWLANVSQHHAAATALGSRSRGLRLGLLVALPAIVAVWDHRRACARRPTQRLAVGRRAGAALGRHTSRFIALGIANRVADEQHRRLRAEHRVSYSLRRTRWVVGASRVLLADITATWP